MTLVDTETGEVVAQCTADDARVLTDRIKVAVEATWELVVQAYNVGAHRALGYAHWDDYCLREFGASRIRLPREERADVVQSLRDAGLSTRAIAAATGLGKSTVNRELAGVPNGTPAPVVCSDCGRLIAQCRCADEDAADELDAQDALAEAARVDTKPAEDVFDAAARVNGTDGKSYPTRPKPKPPTAAEQRALDIAAAQRRSARYLEQLTDVWPYFKGLGRAGEIRDGVVPLLNFATLQALIAIEEEHCEHCRRIDVIDVLRSALDQAVQP